MFLNLATLRSELSSRLKTSVTIGTVRKDLWLNMAQSDVANDMDAENLMVTSTFVSVAAQRKYYLEFDFNKISGVVDQSTNLEIPYVSESDIEILDPQISLVGTPTGYCTYGTEYVRASNSVAGAVTIVSSSASDTSQKVRIRGAINGADDTELLTLNGTTSVPGVKVWDANSIYYIASDSASRSGRVTVTAAPDTLAIIPSNAYAEQKQPLFLWPTPQSALNYRVRGYRKPRLMVNAEDSPDFPEAYHQLVLLGAVVRGHKDTFRIQAAQDVYNNEYSPLLTNLKAQQGNKRAKCSPVIIGDYPMAWFGGRYPNNYPHW